MSDSSTACQGDQESLSDWTMVDHEDSAANEDQGEGGPEDDGLPPKEEVENEELDTDADDEQEEIEDGEEEKNEDVIQLGQKVEEVKSAGLSGTESSDIEHLDYPPTDYCESVASNQSLDFCPGMRDSFTDYVRILQPLSSSYLGDADTESVSSEDLPEEKVRKRRAKKPEATQDEETDLSLASSPSLPHDLPAIKPDLQYVHTPHEDFNRRLNLVVALTLACVFGLGFGHFLGWSSRTLWEANLNAAQVRKLRQLQDNLLSCMSASPHDLPDHTDTLNYPPKCLPDSIIRQNSLSYGKRDEGPSHPSSPLVEMFVEQIEDAGVIFDHGYGRKNFFHASTEDEMDGWRGEHSESPDGLEDKNDDLILKVEDDIFGMLDQNDKPGKVEASTVSSSHEENFNEKSNFESDHEDIIWDESYYIQAPSDRVLPFENPLPENGKDETEASKEDLQLIKKEVEDVLLLPYASLLNDLSKLTLPRLSLEEGIFSSPEEESNDEVFIESFVRESDNIIRKIIYDKHLFNEELRKTREKTHLSLWYPETQYDYNVTSAIIGDYGDDYLNLSDALGIGKDELIVKDAVKRPFVNHFPTIDGKDFFTSVLQANYNNISPQVSKETFLGVSLIETDSTTRKDDYRNLSSATDNYGAHCHAPNISARDESISSKKPTEGTGHIPFLSPPNILPANNLLLESDFGKMLDIIKLENEELRAQHSELQSKNLEPFKIKGKEAKNARDLREEVNRLISDNEDLRLSLIRDKFSKFVGENEVEFHSLVGENHQLRMTVSRLLHLVPDSEKLEESLKILREQHKDLSGSAGKVKLEQTLPKELVPVVKELEEIKALVEEESAKNGPSTKSENAKNYLDFMHQVLSAFSQLHDFDEKSVAEKIDTATDVFSSVLPKGVKLPTKVQDEINKGKSQFNKLKTSIHKKWMQLKGLTHPGNMVRSGQATVTKMNRVIVNVVNKMKEIGRSVLMKDKIQSEVESTMSSFSNGLSKLNKKFEEAWKSIEIHRMISSKRTDENEFNSEAPDFEEVNEESESHQNYSQGASVDPSSNFHRHSSETLKQVKLVKNAEKAPNIDRLSKFDRQVTPPKINKGNGKIQNEHNDGFNDNMKSGTHDLNSKNEKRNSFKKKSDDDKLANDHYLKGHYNKYDKPKASESSSEKTDSTTQGNPKSGLGKLWDDSADNKRKQLKDSNQRKYFIKRKGKGEKRVREFVENEVCLAGDEVDCRGKIKYEKNKFGMQNKYRYRKLKEFGQDDLISPEDLVEIQVLDEVQNVLPRNRQRDTRTFKSDKKLKEKFYKKGICMTNENSKKEIFPKESKHISGKQNTSDSHMMNDIKSGELRSRLDYVMRELDHLIKKNKDETLLKKFNKEYKDNYRNYEGKREHFYNAGQDIKSPLYENEVIKDDFTEPVIKRGRKEKSKGENTKSKYKQENGKKRRQHEVATENEAGKDEASCTFAAGESCEVKKESLLSESNSDVKNDFKFNEKEGKAKNKDLKNKFNQDSSKLVEHSLPKNPREFSHTSKDDSQFRKGQINYIPLENDEETRQFFRLNQKYEEKKKKGPLISGETEESKRIVEKYKKIQKDSEAKIDFNFKKGKNKKMKDNRKGYKETGEKENEKRYKEKEEYGRKYKRMEEHGNEKDLDKEEKKRYERKESDNEKDLDKEEKKKIYKRGEEKGNEKPKRKKYKEEENENKNDIDKRMKGYKRKEEKQNEMDFETPKNKKNKSKDGKENRNSYDKEKMKKYKAKDGKENRIDKDREKVKKYNREVGKEYGKYLEQENGKKFIGREEKNGKRKYKSKDKFDSDKNYRKDGVDSTEPDRKKYKKEKENWTKSEFKNEKGYEDYDEGNARGLQSRTSKNKPIKQNERF